MTATNSLVIGPSTVEKSWAMGLHVRSLHTHCIPAPNRGSGMLVVAVVLCNERSSRSGQFLLKAPGYATQWRKINALSFLVGGGLLWSRRTLLGVF
mmetsp:Transcript_109592/g.353639  ORF Transcript_109592/g.353639 Transcript_109592/m.353639 type:complete len:96 (+) Transcript_109592:682-969(+)